jgi:2-succinyl-6-hydroxy-2,4-cyclohexadiene-1-carboxylate synthase
VAADNSDPDRLAATTVGTGPRVVLLHGFTQTCRCWGPLLGALATDHEVVAVDAPGHGDSAGVAADVVAAAALLGDVGGRAIYAVYSLGGRIALRLAVDRPELVRALVLISASPGIVEPAERADRRSEDERRAGRVEAIGVEAFVDEWLDLPLFATLPREHACRDERLRNTVAGLASSLRLAGTGAQESLWPRVSVLRMPVLLVAGALDHKFLAIARAMAAAIGSNADVAVIDGAGHTAHLEQPDATAQAIRSWLRATAP